MHPHLQSRHVLRSVPYPDPHDLQDILLILLDKTADGKTKYVNGDALTNFRDGTAPTAPGTDPFRLIYQQINVGRLFSSSLLRGTGTFSSTNEPFPTSAVPNSPGQPLPFWLPNTTTSQHPIGSPSSHDRIFQSIARSPPDSAGPVGNLSPTTRAPSLISYLSLRMLRETPWQGWIVSASLIIVNSSDAIML